MAKIVHGYQASWRVPCCGGARQARSLSATFAGSVKHYDIIASGPTGGHVPYKSRP